MSIQYYLLLLQCIELEWWAYLSFIFSFFVLCMGLNYVVKKINEAKIEERFIRMLQKASTTQSTQVDGPSIAVETAKTPQRPSPPGISLVFNHDENKRRTDPYNLILKPKDWKIEVPPLNAYKSMDTINVISIPSDDRTETECIPIKISASDSVASKATSYHVQTEKVLVKNNEFGRRAGKENWSMTIKSDSHVTELITINKNEYGHVAGIGTLPTTRKDTSDLVPENETSRIISRKSSPIIHNINVIQGVTAKESTVKMESSSAKAEESTCNESKNSVAENIPLTNIYSGRMVTTNTRSIVEVSMKKPTFLDDKKCNEEIDSGCSIKKSVDSILSKIVNLTSKNEDHREKSLTDTYVAKQPSSSLCTESSLNINEISYIEKKESSCIDAKETSSHSQNYRVEENTVKKRKSGPIVAKETSLGRIEQHVKDFLSVKKSFTINTPKAAPARTQSNITVSKYFPINRGESGSIVARKKDPLLLHEKRSDDNVAELSLVKTSKSSRVTEKAKSLIVVEKNNGYTDSTVIAETANTSKSTNVEPVKEAPFTDKIKALIKDKSVKNNEPKNSTVIAEIAKTSKTVNDEPVKEIPFTNKLKALIEDENVKNNKPTDRTVIAEIANTSKTANVDPVKEIPFTDKIKALIEDENEKNNEPTGSTVIAEIANTSKTANADPVKEIPFTDKIKALIKDKNVKNNEPTNSTVIAEIANTSKTANVDAVDEQPFTDIINARIEDENEKNNEPTDSTVIAEIANTSKTTNVDSVDEQPFMDIINVTDSMLYKPSSSA